MAIGSINFGGLSSGLDTSQIIEDLMQVEAQPLTRLQSQKQDLSTKKDTYSSIQTNLLSIKTSVMELKSSTAFGEFSASSSDEEALTVTASSLASEGTYSIRTLSLAQAETLSGASYEQADNRLGFDGEIIVNGQALQIKETDTLTDIRNKINTLDAGVNASVLKVTDGDYRLILTSENEGRNGFQIANVGETDILAELGITDGTSQIRETDNGSVLSSQFDSSSATFGSMSGLSSAVTGSVSIAGQSIEVDLGTATLESLRDDINALGIAGVSAAIEVVEADDSTTYRLAISGTTDFTDDNHILESLGILEGGTSGTQAVFSTSDLSSGSGGLPVSETTAIASLGAAVSSGATETITIGGMTSDSSEVSSYLTIDETTTVGDVMVAVEEAFGGDVTVSLEDGRITVSSRDAGATDLDFTIRANNENGGSLDFGAVETIAVGRDRQLAEGRDAVMVVNNIKISRSSNQVNDVITGLNIDLRSADPDSTINITVERDREAVVEKIDAFVTSYNELVDFVNDNASFNEDTEEAGPLLGDLTVNTLMNRLRTSLQTQLTNASLEFRQIVQIGIETTTEGKLTLDKSALNDAMEEDMDAVISLFAATRTSDNNYVEFAYHSDKSVSGTYDVEITKAAEKATVTSSQQSASPSGSGSLSVTDNYGNEMSVAYDTGMSTEDVARIINIEAEKEYAETQRSTTGLVTADQSSVTRNTSIADLQGVTVSDGDTITISGSSVSGRDYSKTILISEGEVVTVGSILDDIESITDSRMKATIDAQGRIQIQDSDTGSNDFTISIESTVDGLEFGTFDILQEGRDKVNAYASVTDDGRLEVSHTLYGSDFSLTLAGGDGLGLDDGTYNGSNIAGTINGYEATGKGQILTASSSDDNARGIVIRSEITAEELSSFGTLTSRITLESGVADLLYSDIQNMTDPVNGFVQTKIDSFETSIASMDDRIDDMNARLDQKREALVRKYTQMEMAMARLQSVQNSLSALG